MIAPRLVQIAGAAALLLAATAVALGCIEVRREVSVTPGTVPEQIQDARWPSPPVSYCIVSSSRGFVDNGRVAELAAEAFARWAVVPGVEVAAANECETAERGNGRNEIVWQARTPGPGSHAEAGVFAAGFTRQLFRVCVTACLGGSQAEIVEADILLSPEPPDEFRSEECLFSTLLHEAGHFLGVPHLESPAVMAPATTECPQELTDADLEALKVLYGEEAEG